VRARHDPPGPGGFGTGSGSVSAVVVMSASMRERAVFIGSIPVWDTIGTLPLPGIEIVRLFRPVYCRVMGRKAPRKRLVRRVMACPTGVPPSTRTFFGAPPTLFAGARSKDAKPGRKNAPREREWLFDIVRWK